MSTDQDLARIVRTWLQEDAHESADRVLEDVLGLLDGNTQRVPFRHVKRIADSRTLATVGLAAAALVVAVVGISLLPARVGPGTPTPPAPTASPSPRPSLAPLPTVAMIEPGPHVLSASHARIHLSMPGGWSGGAWYVERFPPAGWRAALGVSTDIYGITEVVEDVCAAEEDVEFVRVGPEIADLTTALANQRGIQRSGPSDVDVGGYPAQRFALALRPECPGSEGRGIWVQSTGTYGLWLRHGATATVYVVDVDGQRVVIVSHYMRAASSEDVAQLEAITASIEIEPFLDPLPLPSGPVEGWLRIGRHDLTVDEISFSFSVPALFPDRGWARYGSAYISKDTIDGQAAEAMILWTGFPDGVDTDPCTSLLGLPRNPTVADLAAAVSTAPGTQLVAEPSDVTVGGRPAVHVVVTVREDVGCDPGFFFTWDPASGGPGWWASNVGDTIRIWAVDVGGTPFVIAAETTKDAGPGLGQEIQEIVESIQFDE